MKFAKSMKAKLLAKLLAVGAAMVIALPAFAQEAASDKAEVALPENTFLNVQAEEQYLAKDVLIGSKIHNSEGKIIGDIEDIVLNDWNRVVGVVMGTGGFLGVAEKRVGVDLVALSFSEKDGKTVVTLAGVTQEMLKAVPAFERKQPKKSLLERAMEKARELTDKSAVTAKETYEKVKEEAGPAYEKAKEATGKAYEKAKEAAGQAYEKAKEAASPSGEPATTPAAPQQ